jgi:Rieske Fe-S protein
MARQFRLRPAPGAAMDRGEGEGVKTLDRRLFMKYALNTAGGVIAMASLGTIGFASLLMGADSGSGGDAGVRFWVPKGQEDTVWFGSLHLEVMTKSVFQAQAATAVTGMSGAQGVWNGLPVNVVYVPHEENKSSAVSENKPRLQYGEGYDAAGAYIGHGEEMVGTVFEPHDNLLLIFSRCPHLCCIPGWQLVSRAETADNWLPGGVDSGGNKLFCICHSSRYDPTMLEVNRNRNRSNGTLFDYFGIRRTGGPTPVGMPLIPFEIKGDVIEGITDYMDWYTYCD